VYSPESISNIKCWTDNPLNDEVPQEENSGYNTPAGETRIFLCISEDPAHNPATSGSTPENISGYRNNSDNRAADGRPKKAITPEDPEIIDEVYRRFRYGARMFEMQIR